MQRYAQKLMVMLDFAHALSDLSKCIRAKRGAVIVPRDCSMVHSIGYNGPPKGIANGSCTGEVGKCGCVHAEANAVVKLDSTHVRNAIMLSTTIPCYGCAGLIVNCSAIQGVVYRESYRDEAGLELLRAAGIQLVHASTLNKLAQGASWDDLSMVAKEEHANIAKWWSTH